MRIELYIAENGRDEKPANQRYWTQEAASFLTDLCGGCTVLSGEGYYKNSRGYTILDGVSVVYAYTTDTRVLPKVKKFMEDYAKNAHQEAALYVVDTTPFFVGNFDQND